MSELYLVDKDGHRYVFNHDMAQHTTLYAVMRDGHRVRYQGTPSLTTGPTATGVVAGDRAPTEAELLAARQLLARHDHQLGDQIAMSALSARAARAAQDPADRQAASRDEDQQGDLSAAATVAGADEHELPPPPTAAAPPPPPPLPKRPPAPPKT